MRESLPGSGCTRGRSHYLVRMRDQLNLFNQSSASPDGFRYAPDLISSEQEDELVAALATQPFKEFEFQGFLGKRRVVSYGWKYDFNTRELRRSDDMPDFLRRLREQAARFAGMKASALQQVLLTEYRPGAAIGWHKDKAVFGEVIGISLLSPCTFRFRRAAATSWQRAALTVAPRSVYLLQGASRTEWEHSIPGVEQLRYSITFRNFKVG
jgi:alkylated DNA repair dioxygenase AlkB